MSDTLGFSLPTKGTSALSTHQPATDAALTSPPWQTAIVSTLDEVESLLDRAELGGHREHTLTVLGPDTFIVRWR